jgi:predicted GTPase
MDTKTKVDPYAKLKEFLDESSQERITQKLNEHLTTPVNIGIVGSRGSGKSTLIRALTDLFPPDPRAAATGSIHSTRYPTPYLHPESENIVFWDCPGLGSIEQSKSTNSSDFTLKNYFKKISKLGNNMENNKIKKRYFLLPVVFIQEQN